MSPIQKSPSPSHLAKHHPLHLSCSHRRLRHPPNHHSIRPHIVLQQIPPRLLLLPPQHFRDPIFLGFADEEFVRFVDFLEDVVVGFGLRVE